MLRGAGPALRLPARTVARHGVLRQLYTAQNTARPQSRVNNTAMVRISRSQYATIQPTKLDEKEVEKTAHRKIESRPGEVSIDSSTRHVLEEDQAPKPSHDGVLTGGLASDLNTIKETFALRDVPPTSLTLGLAGTIPYFGTSLATVYLGWIINNPHATSSQLANSLMISNESAEHWLQALEPIQVGYGAIIISFLGAIHWGLEYAEKTPSQPRTNYRYALGVLAPAIAWSAVVMPIQFALISQFMSFLAIYGADIHAQRQGWTPQWYGTYRFVLTFIVGGAIMVSLIGREKIGADRPRLTGLREKFHKTGHDADAYRDWEKEEEKERARVAKAQEQEEKAKKAEELKKQDAKNNKKKGEKDSKDKGKIADDEGGEVEEEQDDDEKKVRDDDGEAEDKGDEKKDDDEKDDDEAEENDDGDKKEEKSDDDDGKDEKAKSGDKKGDEKSKKDDKS